LFPELLQFNIQKSKTRNPVILNFEFFRQTEATQCVAYILGISGYNGYRLFF